MAHMLRKFAIHFHGPGLMGKLVHVAFGKRGCWPGDLIWGRAQQSCSSTKQRMDEELVNFWSSKQVLA